MTNRPGGNVRYDNRGRVVLVTGGCQGIGHAICMAFADSGANVVCADVIDKPADLPATIAFKRTDTSNEADCEAAVQWTKQQFGGLDVLVNNAAIHHPVRIHP